MEHQARLEILRNAPLDSWIALSADETRLVGVGRTLEEALREAERNGENDPLILKTPTEWLPLAL